MFTARARRLAAGILTGGVLLGGIVTGPAAMAATAGGGGGGGDGHGGHLRPELVTIKIIQKGNEAPQSEVNAYGPVRGRNGTDDQQSNNLDVLMFDRGNVNVWHQPTTNNQPVTNNRSCTATFTEDGVWKFKGGTGKYRDARGHGTYHLGVFLVFNRMHKGHKDDAQTSGQGGGHKDKGKCDFNGQPKFTSSNVIAVGLASNGHGHGHK
jgi:hypothetical protein